MESLSAGECDPTSPASFSQWLDAIHEQLRLEAEPKGLLWELDALRRRAGAERWRSTLLPLLRAHPVYRLALECPFSSRATRKPRGYAGDALLLDFLYREPTVAPLWESCSKLGRSLCDFWVASPAAAAVRWRRDLVTGLLEGVAREQAQPRAFSVACGHLREALGSEAVRSGAFSQYVGLDQDEASLAHVERYHRFPGLDLQRRSVKSLARSPSMEGRYDLVYALGLYDYLPDSFAKRLTARLFESLRPGGRLLVGNFLPSTPNIASMEALQDWWLVYRTREQLQALAEDVDPCELAERTYSEDPAGCVGVLVLCRAA